MNCKIFKVDFCEKLNNEFVFKFILVIVSIFYCNKWFKLLGPSHTRVER